MTTPEPLVRFYDLSGPKPWSPWCWCTRYAVNYKGILYTTTKLSYPGIKPTCEKLFLDMTGLEATVPIIEILGPDYKVLNDSIPIARLLNERFTEKDGFKDLKGVEGLEEYIKKAERGIIWWIINDVYENALDPDDGSKEYFKTTRESLLKCDLKDVTELKGGGEEKVLETIRKGWALLRERMKGEDGNGERKITSTFPNC
jgi:glutathione S-transferase